MLMENLEQGLQNLVEANFLYGDDDHFSGNYGNTIEEPDYINRSGDVFDRDFNSDWDDEFDNDPSIRRRPVYRQEFQEEPGMRHFESPSLDNEDRYFDDPDDGYWLHGYDWREKPNRNKANIDESEEMVAYTPVEDKEE